MGCSEKVVENGVVVERPCGTAQASRGPAAGPGTELKKLLKAWLGFEAIGGCSCNSLAKKMDRLGPDWVEGPGMPEILAAMQREHGRRRDKGKTVLPWSRFGARFLIRQACRRARAKASA